MLRCRGYLTLSRIRSALSTSRRSQGFATEATRAWVRYAFDELELDSVVSIYEPENVASGAVMRRLGFTLDRESEHPVHRVQLFVMSLARDAWSSL